MARSQRLLAVLPLIALAHLMFGQSAVPPSETGPSAAAVLSSEAYLQPSKALTDLVAAPRHLNISLTNLSPDRTRFLVATSAGMPAIGQLSRTYVNLGGERVDTKANRNRALNFRSSVGLRTFDWEKGAWKNIEIPRGARVSGAQWSPNSLMIAYLAHFDDGSYLYVADASSGKSRKLAKTPLLATLVESVDWTADGTSILAVLQPENRGPAPKPSVEPNQPIVRLTDTVKNQQRTYRGLLEDLYSQTALEYFTTGQLALISAKNGAIRKIGKPAMIRSAGISPDGKHVRVTTMLKPFSYLVPATAFGTLDEIWDSQGKVLVQIEKRELRFGETRTPRPDAKRNLTWRPDGNGLSFIQQEPAPEKKEGQNEDDSQRGSAGRGQGTGDAGTPGRKDRVMQWVAPFRKEDAKLVYESDTRIGSMRYSADCQTLFLSESRAGSEVLYAVKLSDPKTRMTLYSARPDDFYKTPGNLLSTTNSMGISVVRQTADGTGVYLSGTQYFEDPDKNAPRTFIDLVTLANGEKKRIWLGSPDALEEIGAILDAADVKRLAISRQSPWAVANTFLIDISGTPERKLTDNRDVTPETTRAQRYRVQVTRPDGFKYWVRVTTPQGYVKGTKLPAMFWFYPSEYADQKAYDQAQRSYNKNRFPNTGPMSIEHLATQGYAVIQPDTPIVGPTGRMNDSYVNDLRNSLSATIDELERQGIIDRTRLAVGGHSYGAFSAANAMVHTPFFKAGIAGDGAYNRTLTPMQFQSETRILWDARETYLAMSPMLYANQMTGALLMYHGLDDQNVGTDPINSVRMFHALLGLGKPAALYMYPYEDHGPVARETLLDMWARWTAWLDKYVKGAK